MDVLLVSEVSLSSAELEGLDEPVEMLAVDSSVDWGRYWRQEGLEATPPVGSDMPAEGGIFLLRSLRGMDAQSCWQVEPASRRIRVPDKAAHTQLGLPPAALVSNSLFVELRYSLPPSLVANFDFDDLRDGIWRAFALPIPDGEATVRLLLVADEAAAADVLVREGTQTDRVERFLRCAAVSPPSSRWASTLDEERAEADAPQLTGASALVPGLFPHQQRSVIWCEAVEHATAEEALVRVQPLEVSGCRFGGAYSVELPCGGCIGHPPGAGKSRIIASLVQRSERPTLLLCPGHLLPFWEEELRLLLGPPTSSRAEPTTAAGEQPEDPVEESVAAEGDVEAEGVAWGGRVLLLGFHALNRLEVVDATPSQAVAAAPADGAWGGAWGGGAAHPTTHPAPSLTASAAARARRLLYKGRRGSWTEGFVSLNAGRLVVDEPQDAPHASLPAIEALADAFGARWLLCGTAPSHLRLIGSLLCGSKRWRAVATLDEWRGTPSLGHICRHRFLRDPAWACLPQPRLEMLDQPIHPSQHEALAAQATTRLSMGRDPSRLGLALSARPISSRPSTHRVRLRLSTLRPPHLIPSQHSPG